MRLERLWRLTQVRSSAADILPYTYIYIYICIAETDGLSELSMPSATSLKFTQSGNVLLIMYEEFSGTSDSTFSSVILSKNRLNSHRTVHFFIWISRVCCSLRVQNVTCTMQNSSVILRNRTVAVSQFIAIMSFSGILH